MSRLYPDGPPQPRRAIATGAFIVAVLTLVIDSAAIGVALPVIASDFGIPAATSTWVMILYQVTLAALILPMSALGGIVGYRRLYLTGLTLFGCMAAVSALAPTFAVLVTARGLQSLGAAAALSVNLALLRHIVPARRFGRSLGNHALVIALAATTGPTLSGLILSVASWHWIFALSIPGMALAIIVGTLTWPDNVRTTAPFDRRGALFSVLTFGPLPLAAAMFGNGWPLGVVAGLLAVATVAFVALVRRMRDMTTPLLPLDLFSVPVFALSSLASLLASTAQMTVLMTLPFFLQLELGASPLQTGLVFSSWAIAMGVCSPISGRLSDSVHPGSLGTVGLGALTLGLVALMLAPDHPPLVWFVISLSICGIGFALFQSPNNRAIMSVTPRERSGAASGVLGTARQLGQAMGSAIAAFTLSRGVADGWTLALGMAITLSLAGAVSSGFRHRT